MYKYTIHQAKTQLSRILRLVAQGQDVTIVNRNTPVARLVPLEITKRRMGTLAGKIRLAQDFDKPLKDFDEYTK